MEEGEQEDQVAVERDELEDPLASKGVAVVAVDEDEKMLIIAGN